MHLFRYDTGVKKLIHMKNVLEEECSARLAEDSILLDTLIESQQLLQHTVRTSSRCCIWLGCIVLCCVVLHWVVWCGVVWCGVLCCVVWCVALLLHWWSGPSTIMCLVCGTMMCFMSKCTVSYHFILYHIKICHIISCHIIS